jgi:hypothetical protein
MRTHPPSVFANEAQRLGRRRSSPPLCKNSASFSLSNAGEILGGQVGEGEVAHANKIIRVAPPWRQRSDSSTAPSDDEGQRRWAGGRRR